MTPSAKPCAHRIRAQGREGHGAAARGAAPPRSYPRSAHLVSTAADQAHRTPREGRAVLKTLRTPRTQICDGIPQRAARTAHRLPGGEYRATYHEGGANLIGLRQYICGG